MADADEVIQPGGVADPPQARLDSDAALDAGHTGDVAYLSQLGYHQELRRLLGLFSSFAVQFSLIAVSAGLFLTFGYGITTFGPAFFLAWLVGCALQMLVGLSIAELVSAYPLAGGAYQIVSRIARRPVVAWQTGWWLVVAHVVAAASIGVGMAPFVASWFGYHNLSTTAITLWGCGILIVASAVNFIGVRIAALVNNVGVVAESFALTTVIVVILALHHHFNSVSFLTNTGGTVVNGNWIKPFAFALLVPAYVVSSFDSSGNAGEETRSAAWNAPKGVVIANFGAFIYGTIGIGLVLLATVNLKGTMADSFPMTYILKSAIGGWMTQFFVVMVMVSLTVCIEMLVLTASRIVWSQARDGKLPFSPVMRKLNRERIPYAATAVTLVVAVAMLFWGRVLTVLIAMTAFAWAIAYLVAVVAGVYAKMRGTLPKRPWHYGRWWPLIDGLAIVWSVVLCAVLVYQNPRQVGLGFLGLVVIGAVLYAMVPRFGERGGKAPSATAVTGPSKTA
jgi:amino acid transporter